MAVPDTARVLAESLSEAINLAAALQSGDIPASQLLGELLVAADTFVTAHAEAASPDSEATVDSGELNLEDIARILGALRAALSSQGS